MLPYSGYSLRSVRGELAARDVDGRRQFDGFEQVAGVRTDISGAEHPVARELAFQGQVVIVRDGRLENGVVARIVRYSQKRQREADVLRRREWRRERIGDSLIGIAEKGPTDRSS